MLNWRWAPFPSPDEVRPYLRLLTEGVLVVEDLTDWFRASSPYNKSLTMQRNVETRAINLRREPRFLDNMEDALDEALSALPDEEAPDIEWSDDFDADFVPQVGDLGRAVDPKTLEPIHLFHIADRPTIIEGRKYSAVNHTTLRFNFVSRENVQTTDGDRVDMWFLLDKYPVQWAKRSNEKTALSMGEHHPLDEIAAWVKDRLTQVRVVRKKGRLFLTHKSSTFTLWIEGGHLHSNHTRGKPFTVRGMKTVVQRWSAK